MPKTEVLIIGAGPYGIAIANELFANGVPFQIIGKPFDLWLNYTQNHSSIRSDWLTSEVYCPTGRYGFLKFLQEKRFSNKNEILKKRLPVELYRKYLKYVLTQLPYLIEDSKCIQLQQNNGLFQAKLENQKIIEAQVVILATGIESHKYLPAIFQKSNETPIVHSWNVNGVLNIEGKNILVVGRGQSAAEAICQLSKKNKINWLLRKEPEYYSEPINLPVPVFKSLRFLSGLFFYLPLKIRKLLGKKFVSVTITPDLKKYMESNSVKKIFSDVNDLNSLDIYDLIISATGFTYSLDSISFLDNKLKGCIETQGDVPKLNRCFESSCKGLFFAGGITEFSHGPAMRFMMGAPFTAKTIARAVANKF